MSQDLEDDYYGFEGYDDNHKCYSTSANKELSESKQPPQENKELQPVAYDRDGINVLHAHPASRLKYLSSFTGQEMLKQYKKIWTLILHHIETDIKENSGYPFYDVQYALERECFHTFFYIITDGSGMKNPDKFFQGTKGMPFHKSLLPFKKQFGEHALFQVFACTAGDLDQEKYKNICNGLKIERQSVPKTKLQTFREKCIRAFGHGEKLSIAQIKSNWKTDVNSVKTWLELSEETRLNQEAPWLWWCLGARSQANILRAHTVNKRLGVVCTSHHKWLRANSGPNWTCREAIVRRKSV